jgi:hypothetical protein
MPGACGEMPGGVTPGACGIVAGLEPQPFPADSDVLQNAVDAYVSDVGTWDGYFDGLYYGYVKR